MKKGRREAVVRHVVQHLVCRFEQPSGFFVDIDKTPDFSQQLP